MDPLEKISANSFRRRTDLGQKGQQVAVGGKEKTALPLLILWSGSEGRAVLSNVLC